MFYAGNRPIFPSSWPGLTWPSIPFARASCWMDTRVKPAYDEYGRGALHSVRHTDILSRRRAVQAEHMAGEIERARDQDARRHFVSEPRQRTQRRVDGACGFHTHAERAGGIRQPVRRHRIVAVGYLHGDDVAGDPPGKWGGGARGLFWRHAPHPDPRGGYPPFSIARRRRRAA